MSQSLEVELKIRMPADRYLALRHMANEEDRSMNSQVNHLVEKALLEFIDHIKNTTRGQNGDTDSSGD